MARKKQVERRDEEETARLTREQSALRTRLNTFCRHSAFTDPTWAIRVWKTLETFACGERLVRMGTLSRAPGAVRNGPGLRFKSWLIGLVDDPIEGGDPRGRFDLAGELLTALEARLDSATDAFEKALAR